MTQNNSGLEYRTFLENHGTEMLLEFPNRDVLGEEATKAREESLNPEIEIDDNLARYAAAAAHLADTDRPVDRKAREAFFEVSPDIRGVKGIRDVKQKYDGGCKPSKAAEKSLDVDSKEKIADGEALTAILATARETSDVLREAAGQFEEYGGSVDISRPADETPTFGVDTTVEGDVYAISGLAAFYEIDNFDGKLSAEVLNDYAEEVDEIAEELYRNSDIDSFL